MQDRAGDGSLRGLYTRRAENRPLRGLKGALPMKREQYESAELEIIRFDTADLITTSGGDDTEIDTDM